MTGPSDEIKSPGNEGIQSSVSQRALEKLSEPREEAPAQGIKKVWASDSHTELTEWVHVPENDRNGQTLAP